MITFEVARKHKLIESMRKLRNIAFESLFEARTGINYKRAQYLKDHPILKLSNTYPDLED